MEFVEGVKGKVMAIAKVFSINYVKKYILLSAIYSAVGFATLYFLIKKKAGHKFLGDATLANKSFTKNQLDFITKKMKRKGLNVSQMSRVEKRKKLLQYNSMLRKIDRAKGSFQKSDQVFYHIMQKFSSFVVKNKFAFA